MTRRAVAHCIVGWGPGCDSYTGGHACNRAGGHEGRHRCDCGATRAWEPGRTAPASGTKHGPSDAPDAASNAPEVAP